MLARGFDTSARTGVGVSVSVSVSVSVGVRLSCLIPN